MPNIIEQQDLLKGLTDSRLALLMQKPSGDIPPFLVAAEAARRQASREFSGNGSKESVVDSLTRQLANVPQNVKSPMKAPPDIPPPMQMPEQGIAGIPQQGMAEGGRVQPMWTIPNYGGSIPKVMDWVGTKAKDVYNYATTPWGDQPSPPDENTSEPDTTISNTTFPDIGALVPDKKITKPSIPKNPEVGTKDSSPENKYKSQEAAFRKRIEELYGTEEPSNWEDAQKWFAMSQAIMEPGQNLIQSLAGAGAIYAGAESEQAAQQREAERAREEMMLKYDMDIYSQDRAAASAAAAKADDRAFEMLKRGIPDANSLVTYYRETISALGKQLEDPMLPPERKKAIIDEINGYKAEVATLMNRGGGGQEITPGQIDSEMISSIFGK